MDEHRRGLDGRSRYAHIRAEAPSIGSARRYAFADPNALVNKDISARKSAERVN